MFKKICSFTLLSFVAISSFLMGEVNYDIQDIGTLQTHSSEAIALNNQGQILGWYNIDGSTTGKHFFVRDKDGSFHELPNRENRLGCDINWRYLTDDCKAYGTFDDNSNYSVLYLWDQKNGVVRLGNLPGKEISAINNAGQVLIKSVLENEDGKSIRHPVIWDNGKITKLYGLEGDLGIESDEAYGIDMNNKGEVIGQSNVLLSYKNNVYKQIHATKWVNGQAVDLHKTIPKTDTSFAIAINDLSDIIVIGISNPAYLIRNDADISKVAPKVPTNVKKINNNYLYNETYAYENKYMNSITKSCYINEKIKQDGNSIWMNFSKIISMNNNGEIIAQGRTIYGEEHAMLLTPVKSN